MQAIGRVVHDGEVALTAIRTDDGLEIVAVSVEDGTVLWQAPYSMGGRFPGMGFAGFAISGDVVAHMDGTPADLSSSDLVGRDLASGDELWRVPAPWGFGAEGCGAVFCATWVDLDQRRYIVRGIDPASGVTSWRLEGGDIDYVTDDDLAIVLEPGTDPLIHAVAPESGALLWTVDPEQVLDADMTTNGGWNFRRENGVIIAVLGRPLGDDSILAATFGLDETSGELLWSHEDTRLTRWRIDASALASFGDGEEMFDHDRLSRLDPRTGDLEPIIDLPDDETTASGVVFASTIGYGPDGRTVYWQDGDSWVGFDVDTGAPAATPSVMWLSELELEELGELMDGAPASAWLRGVRFGAVDTATGEPVEVAPADIPDFVGPTRGGWTVWIDTDAVLRGIESR